MKILVGVWAAFCGLILHACVAPLPADWSPLANSATTFTSSVGDQNGFEAWTITPLAIIEDSRCPADVQCIHAGTVRAIVRLVAWGQAREATVSLNEGLAMNAHWLHLLGVCPAPKSSEAVAKRDYRLIFAVTQTADRPLLDVACA